MFVTFVLHVQPLKLSFASQKITTVLQTKENFEFQIAKVKSKFFVQNGMVKMISQIKSVFLQKNVHGIVAQIYGKDFELIFQ